MATKQSKGKQETQATEKVKIYTMREMLAISEESTQVSRDLYMILSETISDDLCRGLLYCYSLTMDIVGTGGVESHMKAVKARKDLTRTAKKVLKDLQRANLKKSDGVS